MTPDLSILIGFARGMLLSLRCTCQYLHSGSWIPSGCFVYMSCSLNSLKGVIWGLYRVAIIGLIKGRILAV